MKIWVIKHGKDGQMEKNEVIIEEDRKEEKKTVRMMAQHRCQ